MLHGVLAFIFLATPSIAHEANDSHRHEVTVPPPVICEVGGDCQHPIGSPEWAIWYCANFQQDTTCKAPPYKGVSCKWVETRCVPK